MNDRFQFLKTYADSLIELEKADKDLARELAWKIINYWIYNKNEDSWNPIIEAMFVQIKVMLDKGQDITEKRRNANKQRTNIQQTDNKNEQNLTKDEQKITNEEQTPLKDKKENIKNKNNKINDNKLSLISEDKSSQDNYWNKDVNLCLSLIKQFNNWIINWADSNNRKYAWNLIRKLKQLDSVQKWKYSWSEVLESILMIISKDEYHRTKIGSPQLIFNNLATLIQRCWAIWEKQNQGTTTLELI